MTRSKLSEWFGLDDRVAVVTGGGANGGIGHAVALALAHAGADVLVSDVDSEGAAETAGEILRLGRRALAVRADLGQPDDVLAMMAAVDQEFGRVDILVNNVGIGHRSRPEAPLASKTGARWSPSTSTAPSWRPARPAAA